MSINQSYNEIIRHIFTPGPQLAIRKPSTSLQVVDLAVYLSQLFLSHELERVDENSLFFVYN